MAGALMMMMMVMMMIVLITGYQEQRNRRRLMLCNSLDEVLSCRQVRRRSHQWGADLEIARKKFE